VIEPLHQDNSIYNEKLQRRVHKKDAFPMDVYFCTGSQNSQNKTDNKIYVMKWGEMAKTTYDDQLPKEDSEDDDEDLIAKNNLKEPVIRYECVPHRGAINRIRSMQGSSVVATWSEDGEVGIYDIQAAIDELDKAVDDTS
jgi:hypothetical protein